MSTPDRPSSWDLAQVLAESTRRRIFNAVRAAGRPVTRDEVASLTGVNRRLVTFHLDRLATSGLLTVDFARPESRRNGPGAGRPAKRYAAVPLQLDLTMPRRSYDLAARVLAAGIVADPADAASGALRVAHDEGRAVGRARASAARASVNQRVETICGALSDVGYEPRTEGRAEIRLGNCPFRSVADLAPDLVCGINREFIDGLVDGANARPAEVALEPQEAPNCCVTVRLTAKR